MFKPFRWNIILFLLLQLGGESARKPVAHRAVSFEDFRRGKVLIGSSVELENYSKTRPSDCATFCLATPECLSIKFCKTGRCSLSSADIHSEGAVLDENPSCDYFGMKREEAVVCEEKGVSWSVANVSKVDRCKVKEKKHEVQWGDWGAWERESEKDKEYIVNGITVQEWQATKSRDCLGLPAHGNNCQGKGAQIEWFKVDGSESTWENAKESCKNSGGKLFPNLDGTGEQILFLSTQSYLNNDRRYWIGVRFVNNSWIDLNGRIVGNENLKWHSGHPTGSVGNAVGIYQHRLFAAPVQSTQAFICDLSQQIVQQSP